MEIKANNAMPKEDNLDEIIENETKNEEENVKVDLDTILSNEIGQFGRFQLRMLALTGLAVFFMGFNVEFVFSTARINTRCLIPQCEDASNAEFDAPWLATALPSSGGSFDSCQRFANTTDAVFSNHSCPAHLFNASVTLPCEEYVYENKNSVVYDFDLACDEWRRSLLGFCSTLGGFFSIPLTGFVSDRWGRRTALALNAFNSAWLGLLRYWANSYALYMTLEIAKTVLSGGSFVTSIILGMEIVGPDYRTIVGGILFGCSPLGLIVLGLIAWVVPDWRAFTLAIYIPQFLTTPYFWIVAESVRWYLSTSRYQEAEALLKKVARINRKELSEKSLKLFRISAEEDKKKKAIEEAERAQEPWLPVLVFRHKKILLNCMVMPVCWISAELMFYGLAIMSVNISLSGNKYLNFIAVAAGDIPGLCIAIFLLSRIGRKLLLMVAFWASAACQAAYIFIPKGNHALLLSVYLIGKCSSSTVLSALYVYTAELFPTRHRNSLFAFSATVGRIGVIAAPLAPAIGAATFEEMPFVLFGSFALVSGLLILLTPETLGTKLPDTMEEANNIGRKKQPA